MSHYLTYVLVPSDIHDPEFHVTELLAPYCQELDGGPQRRVCDCVWFSAIQKAEEMPNWKTQGPCFVFSKEEFSVPGFELDWLRKVLELGSHNPDCDECGGTGITFARENPACKWDGWDIGTGFVDGILKDCLIEPAANPNVVPVRAIDLERVPEPHHIVTPRGDWLSVNEFIWWFNAVVVDENWRETTKRVLGQHKCATLVVVNLHL